jgi:hypothetical protein
MPWKKEGAAVFVLKSPEFHFFAVAPNVGRRPSNGAPLGSKKLIATKQTYLIPTTVSWILAFPFQMLNTRGEEEKRPGRKNRSAPRTR